MNRSNVISNEVRDLDDEVVVKKQRNATLDFSPAERVRNDVLLNLQKEHKEEKKKYLKAMDGYRFSQALGLVYEFIWHRFADFYIEQLKDEVINGNIEALEMMEEVYLENLKMLHPFTPFVTEAVWKVFKGKENSILEVKI